MRYLILSLAFCCSPALALFGEDLPVLWAMYGEQITSTAKLAKLLEVGQDQIEMVKEVYDSVDEQYENANQAVFLANRIVQAKRDVEFRNGMTSIYNVASDIDGYSSNSMSLLNKIGKGNRNIVLAFSGSLNKSENTSPESDMKLLSKSRNLGKSLIVANNFQARLSARSFSKLSDISHLMQINVVNQVLANEVKRQEFLKEVVNDFYTKQWFGMLPENASLEEYFEKETGEQLGPYVNNGARPSLSSDYDLKKGSYGI